MISRPPYHWDNYISCIILHMLLPLLPLLLELWLTGTISVKSIPLAASMYTISIGISSQIKSQFVFTIIVSLLCTFAYGIAASQQSPLRLNNELSFIGIVAVFIWHLIERFERHIINRTPFLEFKREGSD